MKQFLIRHRKNIILQALYTSSILSVIVYAALRALFFEFPMPWAEEFSFFFRIIVCSNIVIAVATGVPAWVYSKIQDKLYRGKDCDESSGSN